MTETFVKERKHNLTGKVEQVGIDDASLFLARFDNGSLATFRGHPLRPRPQGALHVRDQRRARLDLLGPARSAPAAVFRSSRRRARARLAVDSHHRRRSSLHEPLVGARPADRLRAYVRPPGGRLPGRTRRRTSRRRRRSGTRSPPTRSRTRCCVRRTAASGSGPEWASCPPEHGLAAHLDSNATASLSPIRALMTGDGPAER